MKLILTLMMGFMSLIISSQTFVSTSPENKNVVLEEFTGIYCTFCPDGHLIAQTLHDANPSDVFLINIHTGGYSNPNGPSDPDFNTLFGGAIGIALTYGVAFIANRVLAGNNFLSVEMSGTVVLYAVIVSFCVGIIFGLYPARNASKLQPVDALRSD